MANPQQLDLLRQGTQAWNTWRNEHKETDPKLSHANLSGANLSYANLRDADLSYAHLRDAHLSYANLSHADLSHADLSYSNLRDADLSYAHLRDAHLIYADLSDADLRDAHLRDAHLRDANLIYADLSHADLRGADLSHAHLSGAHLRDADLSHAHLSYAFMNNTSLGDRDLRTIKGLETVYHGGPSPLSINTIYLSQGDISEAFVRGTGAPDSFLEYMKALASKPIEYYTCFLSYSSMDEAFAKRLHADLQQHGVRCWFAPHNLRPGDLILARLDEAIRLYDKLVLILSQHSVKSRWVDLEVTAAKTKEVHQDCQMLFPLRLDETVMTTTKAWARSLREQRHIADFTSWKDHDDYQQAFTRLLRDLQPETKP